VPAAANRNAHANRNADRGSRPPCGDTKLFTFTISNDSSQIATVDLGLITFDVPSDWKVTVDPSGSIQIGPHEKRVITVTVRIPCSPTPSDGEVWCCKPDGDVEMNTPQYCDQVGGTYYATESEAIAACEGEALPSEMWCCFDGHVDLTTEEICLNNGGQIFATEEEAAKMKQRIAKPAPMIAGNAAPVPAIPFAEMESATNTAKRTASHAPRIAVAADLFAVMESAKRKKIANPATGIVSANRFAGMENVSSGKTVRNVPVIGMSR